MIYFENTYYLILFKITYKFVYKEKKPNKLNARKHFFKKNSGVVSALLHFFSGLDLHRVGFPLVPPLFLLLGPRV